MANANLNPNEQGLISLTPELLKELITHAIAESKKPTAEEQAKITAEKEKQESIWQEKIKTARQIEQQQKCLWGMCDCEKNGRNELGELVTPHLRLPCSHRKANGRFAIFGQLHSDNKVHPICVMCQKPMGEFSMAEAQARGYTPS